MLGLDLYWSARISTILDFDLYDELLIAALRWTRRELSACTDDSRLGGRTIVARFEVCKWRENFVGRSIRKGHHSVEKGWE